MPTTKIIREDPARYAICINCCSDMAADPRNIEIADAISINNIKPKNNQSRLAVIRI